MSNKRHPMAWVPSLYFAEALPYVAVMTISVVMYQRMGLSNAEVAFYTSWLYLPWVIKPFWSPVVDSLRTKRWWILAMQLLIGAGMAGVAFTINAATWLQFTLAFFYLMAFSSATHDIAADGFYMLALDAHDQSLYVGLRSTFYRVGTLVGSSALVALAGHIEESTHRIPFAWTVAFFTLSGLFLLLFFWHFYALPRTDADVARHDTHIFGQYLTILRDFFTREQAAVAIAFMLLYRLPEAMLVKICPLFLLDADGMNLSTTQLAQAQGVWGVIGLTIGGIVGGIAAARHGLKAWLWPMVAAISLPDLVYVWMSYQPTMPYWGVSALIFVEQFGYGFGFTAYMLYLMYYARGEHQTAHYAFCTGLMALSMMLPGMVAGYIQEAIGYSHFFILTIALCLVTVAVSALLKIDPTYGRKA